MLKKQLGLFNVFSLAAGTMISSGLFVLPGIAFSIAGPSIVLAYALAGVLMLPALLSKCELASAMPKSGGTYFFTERSLGPLMGTIAGLADSLALALKASFALIGMAAMVKIIFPQSDEITLKIIAIILCLFFATLNLLSVKGTGRFQNTMVIGLLLVLTIYFVRGIPEVQASKYEPFVPFGIKSLLAATGMAFISFGGISKIVAIAEEVNSYRSLIIGMFLAFGVVMFLYIIVVFVTVGVVDHNELAGSLVPIELGAKVLMGNIGTAIISIAAFLAFATTANGGILSSSRTPMAMSIDGLLPEIISRTNKKFHTPHVSIALISAFIIIVVSILNVEQLVKTASAILILTFILDQIALIIMRFSGIQSYRPTFKVPLVPWLQIATIITYLFIILEMGYIPIAICTCFALIAVIWYLLYVQRKIDRESAIVYFVKRIVSRHISRSGLEDELKQIALERDNITFDRFDKLIHNAMILDIQKPISAKDFFEMIAEKLSEKIGHDKDKLFKLFLDRERESTTVIAPGLAIPHIVINGENIFEIILIRCKDGIIFSELQEPVKIAFVLIGSQDERNFHLKALMGIAHIVNEADFEKRWFNAANHEQLRDIILLSGRKREEASNGI